MYYDFNQQIASEILPVVLVHTYSMHEITFSSSTVYHKIKMYTYLIESLEIGRRYFETLTLKLEHDVALLLINENSIADFVI